MTRKTALREKTDPVVYVSELCKSYRPVQAVREVSFEVRRGEVFKLVGPNGSGKTTIVEILEGLRSYDSGSFSVLGRSPSHPLVKQSVGVFLQESRPMDNLTPREILRLYRTFYDRGLEPDEALASVALEPQSRRLIRKLSTGQERRVDIAIVIINDPLLVFLDEPTLGLDPVARRNFWDIIRNLRARGRSVVLTTHYMDEAEALSDRIAILSYGRILAIDPPDRLIESSGLKQSIRIRFVPPVSKKIRAFFSGIPDAHWHDTALSFTAVDIERVLPRLFKEIHDYGIEIAELGVHRPTIEEVFHLLTSRSNSDA